VTAAALTQADVRNTSFLEAFVDHYHRRYVDRMNAWPAFRQSRCMHSRFARIRKGNDLVIGEHRADFATFIEASTGLAEAVRLLSEAGLTATHHHRDNLDVLCVRAAGWVCKTRCRGCEKCKPAVDS
jgi:hypothetical protein